MQMIVARLLASRNLSSKLTVDGKRPTVTAPFVSTAPSERSGNSCMDYSAFHWMLR